MTIDFSILTAEHLRGAAREIDENGSEPFGTSKTYEAIVDGRTYPPKALIGIAYRLATGVQLTPYDFLGGEEPSPANQIIRKLGFEVSIRAEAGADWTEQELGLVVADYFDMLQAELSQVLFSKTDHRNRLLEHLLARSKGSVEFKHQNISAVLLELGFPFIRGYKPARNYQAKLADTVEDFLDAHSDFFEQPMIMATLEPTAPCPAPTSASDRFVDIPPEFVGFHSASTTKSRRGRRIDFVERDARNRQLGRAGELWACDLERLRLREANRDDLAQKVEWVTDTQGDGLGFDILSFDSQSEAKRKIEVKTTALSRLHPFLVTRNELALSEEEPEHFNLYRVFEFGVGPQVFVLPGSLSATAQLEAVLYRASPPFSSG